MFDFLNLTAEDDAIALLKKDHDTVKELFGEFMNAEDLAARKRICAQTIKELKIHAIIEEEIFYPALRGKLEKDIMNEADEEHHVAKLLVAELDNMSGTEDHYKSKYHVLSENIRHHVKEEEEKMFPKARDTDVDFSALGKKLIARKQELMKGPIPLSSEDKLIARHGKNDDSPAQAAKKKTVVKQVNKKPLAQKAKAIVKKLTPKKTAAKKPATKKSASPVKPKLKSKLAAKKVLPFKKPTASKKVPVKPSSKSRKAH